MFRTGHANLKLIFFYIFFAFGNLTILYYELLRLVLKDNHEVLEQKKIEKNLLQEYMATERWKSKPYLH